MPSGQPEYLTTQELAELLRVKERKVYELASSGEIPCSRATGKLLFPRAEIDAWLARHRSGGVGRTESQARPAVFVGSHDPLLEWALRESGSGIPGFFDGSLDGLERLGKGEAIGAGLHLTESQRQWNRGHVMAALPDQPLVLLEWAWRQQGLILAPGNPAGIGGVADLAGKTFIPRQRRAGTFVLLERLLEAEGLTTDHLRLAAAPARTQTEVATAVADGKAQAGLGLACVAVRFGLDFLPLARERYDLLIDRRAYFEPPVQRLIGFCADPRFAEMADTLGGYDVSGLGTVRYNGP